MHKCNSSYQFGDVVSGRSLSGEEHNTGVALLPLLWAQRLEGEVPVDNTKDVQGLTL